MTSALDRDGGRAVPDPYDDLRKISERLRVMVEEYDEEPSEIDGGVSDEVSDEADVISVVKEAYKLMKGRINDPGSPLRERRGVWAAFNEQQDEFRMFYRTAIRELEILREWLPSYIDLKDQLLSRGEPRKLLENERVLREQRDNCIDAVTNFYGKFSGMLTGL